MSPTVPAILVLMSAVWLALRLSESLPRMESSIRFAGFSAVTQWRNVLLICGALALVLGAGTVGLVVGDFPIAPADAIRTALIDRGGEFDFVVNTLRFPRVTVAILAGMCLAASGAIFQTLIGNPLVSPDVIGIDQGAAVCAVFILVVGGDVALLPFAAFVGAITTATVIYLLAWRQGVSGSRLVLVGIGINSLLAAFVTFLLVRFPIEFVAAAARWQAGTLFGAGWNDARTLAVGLCVLGPAAWLAVRRLRVLQLGDDVAAGLGVSVERDRLGIIVIASALAALAVAVVGPLSFVALVVPHIARLLGGPLSAGLLVFTALLGGLMLLGADLVAQRVFAPTTLPAGVVTAGLGGPYFLYLLYRHNRG